MQTNVACVQPPPPLWKTGVGAAVRRLKQTYKWGFIALVLAFLKYCWARAVNYKFPNRNAFYRQNHHSPVLPILTSIWLYCIPLVFVFSRKWIISLFQSTLWFFGSCLNCQKLARPRPFNTRNNSSWICCSDSLINFVFETNFRLLESPLFFVFISVLLKHRWRAFIPLKSLQSEYRLSELYTSKWVP